MSTTNEPILEIEKISLDGVVHHIRDNSAVREILMNGNTVVNSNGTVNLGTVIIDISGKADKVSNPRSGSFVTLDSNGNIIDSGRKDSDFVHTTGDETINGHKSFSQETSFNGGAILNGNAVRNVDLSGFDWILDNNNNTVQGALDLKEDINNKVVTISSLSTDSQYPTAKCMWDIIGDVETLINAL